jgi:hypothetical protein
LRGWPDAPDGASRFFSTGLDQEDTMGKTGRKRRARKKNKANHGKRPNA